MSGQRIRRWLSNPVLMEWDEPVAWSDLSRQRSYEALREVTRVMAVRSAPVAALLLAVGFWLIDRIPGGGEPLPPLARILIVVSMVAGLVLPLVLVCFHAPKRGAVRRIRLRSRGPEIVTGDRAHGVRRWAQFDAFDFGSWEGLDLLKLRLRGDWLSRRLHGRVVTAMAFESPMTAHSLRECLRGRGLREEPLGEPRAHL